MPDPNLFKTEKILDATLEKRGLLEELNLPPEAIRFIRANQKLLIVAVVVLVAAIVAGSGYNRYRAKFEDRAAHALAMAMEKSDPAEREQVLSRFLEEYGSSRAALWGRLERAHLLRDKGDYARAVAGYREILDELGADHPSTPLVRLSLAETLLASGEYANAASILEDLEKVEGLGQLAMLHLIDAHGLAGNKEAARNAYDRLLGREDLSPVVREIALAKWSALRP